MPAPCQLPKAKLQALEVNKKQWGIGAEGGAAVTASAMLHQFLVTHAPASAFFATRVLVRQNSPCGSVRRQEEEGRERCFVKGVSGAVCLAQAAPAAKKAAAAPAPKAAAKKAAAADAGPVSMGFSGVPADFARPVVNCPSGYPAEQTTQTVRCPLLPLSLLLILASVSCPVCSRTMHGDYISMLRVGCSNPLYGVSTVYV